MAQRVSHERHAPHDDKATEQSAIEPEQDAAEKGETQRWIAEGEKTQGLLADGGFREIADAGGVSCGWTQKQTQQRD